MESSSKEHFNSQSSTLTQLPTSGNEEKLSQGNNVTKSEQRILDRQLETTAVEASFFMLFRYATKTDLAILAISAISATLAGAALPALAVLEVQFFTNFTSFNEAALIQFRHQTSRFALFFVYTAIGTFVTTYISMLGFCYTGEHITQSLREEYLSAILRQNIAFYDNLGPGEITTRITSDMISIQNGISEKVGLTIIGIATFVGCLIISFYKDWRLTLVLLSMVVVTVGSGFVWSKLMIKYQKAAQVYSGAGATLAEEVFASIRNVTALGTQNRLAEVYEGFLLKAEKGGFRMESVLGFSMASVFFNMFANYALSFWQGSRFLVQGHSNANDVITVLLAMVMGAAQVAKVFPFFKAFNIAIAVAGPIFSLIDRPSVNTTKSINSTQITSVKGDIELRNIKHIYPSRQDVVVLKDINLTIPAGKVTALVGPSGSGKSTIIGLIERFYEPVAGQVLLDGQDIQALDIKWLRQQISLVSQEPVLFRTSVYNNIAHGLIGSAFEDVGNEEKTRMVIEAAKMANAHDFITSLPEGYETDVGERGFLMSGGQKQRIAIARAVISDPKILLLDEATSALDTKSEGVVQAALDKVSRGRTTVVIAHRLSTVRDADCIVVLAEGSIVEQGSHGELVERNGVYVQLLEAQKMVGAKVGVVDDLEDGKEDSEKTIVESEVEYNIKNDKEKGEMMAQNSQTITAPNSKEDVNVNPKFNYSLWSSIKFVARLNKSEIPHMLFGISCTIISGSANPFLAIYLGKCIIALFHPPSEYHQLRHDINFWSLMYFITGIVLFITWALQRICFAYSSERLIFYARSKAIRSILRQDISFFDSPENSSGSLVSKLSTEVQGVAGMTGQTLGAIFCAIVTITFSVILAIALNWKLGLVCCTTIPYILVCGYWRYKTISDFNLRARKAHEQSASYACEATSALRTILSLTRESDVQNTYHSMLKSQLSKSLKSAAKTSTLNALAQTGIFVGLALSFWYGGELISKHEISVQNFLIASMAVIFGANSAGQIFSLAPEMGKARDAADKLQQLFEMKPDIDIWDEDGEKLEDSDIEGAIEFKNVRFRYPTRMRQEVLKGVDLKFPAGKTVALVGASGCGKSTIVALIERFYDPVFGSILLDGKDIKSLNLREYRRRIALVSQEPVLYSGSIWDNIVSGAVEEDVSEEKVEIACRDANIWEFVSSLPDGLKTIVGSKGVMLSGGQKQRVAIARALISDPKILLLDEATSALDSTSERLVQQAIDKASKGRTTIVVAHRLSTIQHADLIYVLDQGLAIETGSHEELMGRKGKYSELVGLQGFKGKE